MNLAIVVTCEHGGNGVPRTYTPLFQSARARGVLASHRGIDFGALDLAKAVSKQLTAPLIAAAVTRLLVDLNRSPRHPALFSEFSRVLDARARQQVLDRYYHPHRDRVTDEIRAFVEHQCCVLHLAMHSFAPRLGSDVRRAHIGLLYDPARLPEREFCARWKATLKDLEPTIRVRRNYPYLGKASGLTTHLRRLLGAKQYLGIEIEVNQRLLRGSVRVRSATRDLLCASLASLVRTR